MSLIDRPVAAGPSDAAPIDDFVAIVADAWRVAFGGKDAEQHASILELRTGSGRVYRLLAEIEKATGLSLPVTTVFQAPTIPALAEILRSGQPPAFTPLIPIRCGTQGAPLFVFPGLGGSVFQLFELARSVRHRGPVYVCQQAGLDGRLAPHRTIDDMTQFQLAAIKSRQPSGPFFLLGYSLGGVLALEVARCLIDEGETVAFVGMIEPGLPETLWPLRVRLSFLAQRGLHHVRKLRALPLRQGVAYVKSHAGSLIGRIGRLLGMGAGGWSPYRADGLPAGLSELREANLEAIYGYRLKPFSGRVTLFKSRQGDPLSCDPLQVWPHYVRQLDVITVPGGHETMLRGRNVLALAAEVSQCLDQFGALAA